MTDSAVPPYRVAIVRAATGLGQGLALYLLYLAYDSKSWPASGYIFAPLALIAFFVPLIVIQGIGNIRKRTLMIWAGFATFLIGSLAAYDVWHAWPVDFEGANSRPHILPSPPLCMALVAGLFIAQALVTAGDSERRWMASYTTHFDVAWKLALQAALAAAFTGAFWIVLWLAAGLFNLIKIDAVERLLEHKWFAFPATTLAFAAALHITDVRSDIVRGMRTLALTLLSWLLPLMALISLGFLLAILFTGVQPLWDTRFATGLLLAAAATLVMLINASYQDGDPERMAPRILRYAGTIAAVVLFPLVLLAAIALGLRVAQYGWTTDRIYAAASVFVAAFYTLGYTWAALQWRGQWLKRIEPWNFYASLAVLGMLLLLFSPVLDPYRISVADQMARLESSRIAAPEFDFVNLRWNGGRFGYEALNRLTKTTGDSNVGVRRDALAALQLQSPSRGVSTSIDAADFASRIVIHTDDGKLPASFTAANLSTPLACLSAAAKESCSAWMMDVTDDGIPDVMILDEVTLWVFTEKPAGKWLAVGNWSLAGACETFKDTARAGRFQAITPVRPRWPDLEVAGQRFAFHETNAAAPPCPR